MRFHEANIPQTQHARIAVELDFPIDGVGVYPVGQTIFENVRATLFQKLAGLKRLDTAHKFAPGASSMTDLASEGDRLLRRVPSVGR